MVELPSKVLIFSAFLCVYISEIKGRPNNFDDVTVVEDQNKFEESDLLKKSKTNSGGQDKGHKENKGNKKQIIDALHLGPYHHGHPWGTVSQWPGFHWAGHPSRHGGWTGYPSLGGWHKSHISKKNSKKSAHKASLKRTMLPTFAFPSYGFAYPSLGFAAVPFTPSPIPWGYAVYRSKVPEESSKGQPRSSVRGSKANKRWWPGYMGGWGGWGLGNGGYPGWGPLGGWGHGYDFGGFGHGWGVGFGNSYHPFLRAEIPGNHAKKDKAQKRWWPGYMGGWGGWGLGNSGYPGWGPLGDYWGRGWGGYGYGHGIGLGYGYGHGFGLGYGNGLGFRSDVPGTEDSKEEEGPKRGFTNQPFGGIDFPWYGYGPFADYGYPFFGQSQYIPYPAALYGDLIPFYGLGPYAGSAFGYGFPGRPGLFRSKIPIDKSKKELKKEEKATSRHFVYNFHPGRMGWGGVLYPSHGYRGVFPLLGTHSYGPYGAGYYGPYGPPRGSIGPYLRSNVPENTEESPQSRQVINYNPGCCGWGGCVYPGCGFIGGWTWPLPCHSHHCGCCPCWTRSKAPKKQELKEEKGKSRQEIESPGEGEGNEEKSDDPRTRPHLEGADLLNSEMQTLAMGFPGIEKLQTPMGLSSQGGQEVQGFSDQEMESNGEQSSPEPAEAPGNVAAMTGMTPDVGGNDLKPSSLGNMEEQQHDGQQQSAEELMSSFNMGPSSEGEAPVESFGETGNPNMYPNGAEGQATESASRRADIPGQEDEELAKKQAVAYPYHYFYPGYTTAHGITPYYHFMPINYAQHLMAYPSAYQLAHTGYFPQPLAPYRDRPTHSIHVGAPNVNVDVHTTREHVAHSPEKQRRGKLKELVGEYSDKLKFKRKHSQSSHGKKVAKRQIPSFMSPSMSRPMGFAPPLRYPVPNTASLIGRSLSPFNMDPSLLQSQPFNMNAMSRSGLPAMPSSVIGTSPLGLSGIRAPQMRPSLTPSEMAFSRQLSSMAGISIPISAQPGMGIVGVAQRKKRSPSKKSSKKHSKTTKRQFLAAMPQAFPTGLLPAFSLPTVPFVGPASPVFPSFPLPQTQQPMAFKSSAFPVFQPKPATARLSGIKLDTLGARRMPMMSPFSGYPYMTQNSPFVKVPQFQNANFFRGTPSSPWAPVRQSMSGFPQAFERNPEPAVPEMQQSEGPVQMSGEQFAGFNPSSFSLGRPQPQTMFPEEGPGSEGQQAAFMGPQKEMASFYQVPGEGGMIESPRFNMQPGLAALKKSSVPSKKHNKEKTSKSKRQTTL